MPNCRSKGVRALRGYFDPPMRSKIKFALHKFLLISLLERSRIDSTFTVAMVTKMAAKIG